MLDEVIQEMREGPKSAVSTNITPRSAGEALSMVCPLFSTFPPFPPISRGCAHPKFVRVLR